MKIDKFALLIATIWFASATGILLQMPRAASTNIQFLDSLFAVVEVIIGLIYLNKAFFDKQAKVAPKNSSKNK